MKYGRNWSEHKCLRTTKASSLSGLPGPLFRQTTKCEPSHITTHCLLSQPDSLQTGRNLLLLWKVRNIPGFHMFISLSDQFQTEKFSHRSSKAQGNGKIHRCPQYPCCLIFFLLEKVLTLYPLRKKCKETQGFTSHMIQLDSLGVQKDLASFLLCLFIQ